MNGWVLPDEVLREAPTYTPRPHELADLELLLSSAYAPLTGFLGRNDLTSLNRRGRLADGTSWPVPVTLEVPRSLVQQIDTANPVRRVVVLTDTEGAPMAALDATDVWPSRESMSGVGGRVRRIGDGGHGPFRRLRRTPAEIRTLAERWHVARLLDGTGLSYRDIHDATGVSTTTVVRVARFLREERNGGYRRAIDALGGGDAR